MKQSKPSHQKSRMGQDGKNKKSKIIIIIFFYIVAFLFCPKQI